VTGPIVAELLQDLEAGPIYDDAGRRSLNEVKVGEIGGLLVFVFADEHPPPHFCVKYGYESANFRISDGAKMQGKLDRFERNIRKWYKKNRAHIIEQWNLNRPTDCPVGDFKD
jgi:hypothetical protein